jgi:hypothetical protein
LQTREGAAEIVDLKKFESIALRYVTREEYERALSASFGPIDEAISEKAPRGQKKDMVEEFREALKAEGAIKRGEPFSFLRVKSGKA